MTTVETTAGLFAPTGLPVPDPATAKVVVPAPGPGVGHWAGAPSAVADGDGFWLAYRLRRPVALGRGVAVEIARYRNGRTEVVARVEREAFGAESLERPALVRRPDGGWRLYVSCATPGSKHWWVEALDADEVVGLPGGVRTLVWPGSAALAVKDPVVRCDADGWHAWVCCHPLDEAGEEDRMWSAYARSDDGLVWSEPVPVLEPGADGWDRRGRRITAVVRGERLAAFYDGRADAAQNWYERTGLALSQVGAGPDAGLSPQGAGPVAQAPAGTGALRYLCVVPLADGSWRLFYEASRADGAHDLVTQVVPAG